MTYYVPAAMIHVGPWHFYPELMWARNMHNGSLALFYRTDTGWVIRCINCPATWMLQELSNWFAKWIKGEVK